MASEFLTALSNQFVDRIPTGVEDLLPSVDKAYSNVISPSTEVTWDNFTTGWKTYNTYLTSVGGAFRYDQNIHGPDMTEGNITNNIAGRDTFPAYSDVVMPDYGRYSLTLANVSGNVAVDLRMIRNQFINDTVEDYPGRVMKAAAHNMAQSQALCFYLDNSGRIVTLGTEGGNTAASLSGNSVTITNTTDDEGVFAIDAASTQVGRRRRLLPGMQVDVWSYDMSTRYTANGWAIVDSHMDYFRGTEMILRFSSTADASTFTDLVNADSTDVVLTPYTSQATGETGTGHSMLPIGYQQWALKSGTLFGNFGSLDVGTTGTMFRSLVDDVSGSLTASDLNLYLDAFAEANGDFLDTIFMTNGILQDMLDLYGLADSGEGFGDAGRYNLNRNQDEAQKQTLGYEKDPITYKYDGKVYRIETSHFMTPGQVYIAKTGDGNFKRYQPPKIPGMDASPESGRYEWDPSIEWLGKWHGDTIWMDSRNTGGGTTTGVEAPFMKVTQNGVKEPRGILLTGVTEQSKIGTDI